MSKPVQMPKRIVDAFHYVLNTTPEYKMLQAHAVYPTAWTGPAAPLNDVSFGKLYMMLKNGVEVRPETITVTITREQLRRIRDAFADDGTGWDSGLRWLFNDVLQRPEVLRK